MANNDSSTAEKLLKVKWHQSGGKPEFPSQTIALLQQSVEKTVKALMVAAGENEDDLKKRPFGHDSLTTVLEFLKRGLSKPFYIDTMEPYLEANSTSFQNIDEVKSHIDDILLQLKQGYARKLAVLSCDEIRYLIDFMEDGRKDLVSNVNASFPRRYTLTVGSGQSELMDAIDRVLEIARSRSDSVTLSADGITANKTIAINFLYYKYPRLLEDHPCGHRSTVTIDRSETLLPVALSAWAFPCLMILAALTFPHATSCRYPAPKGAPDDPEIASEQGMLGAKPYTPALGIVNHLHELNCQTDRVLRDLRPFLWGTALLGEPVAGE